MRTLTAQIDLRNEAFFEAIESQIHLSQLSTSALEGLILEHYQFSNRNTGFLAAAAECSKELGSNLVYQELLRNLAEENGHAEMYRKSLAKIGSDTAQRKTFLPTEKFFDQLEMQISQDPSTMLGLMYATEAAALFEHRTFLAICRELIRRRKKEGAGKTLCGFHQMHLDGVEQAHKDGLGQFIDATEEKLRPLVRYTNICEIGVDRNKVKSAAFDAIAAMELWWQSLLSQAYRN